MNGRERIRRAMKCEPTDRTPWVPFVGCHAGQLIGEQAEAYLKSEQKMIQGLSEAIRRYQPDGIPVVFDLQLEAETLGCELKWAEENPPAVISHPLVLGKKLSDLSLPSLDSPRIWAVLNATRQLRQSHPDLALYGLITGPFTLALHLLGTDIFMNMFDDPNGIHDLMAFCRDVGLTMSEHFLDAGCDVIAVVDPMTSQIGPEQFSEFVTPYCAALFNAVRSRGGLGSFFVCGHAQQNVKAMCACKPDNLSVDENIPLDFVRDICLAQNISFGGNLQLTSVLLLGTPEDAQQNALNCLDVGGTRGFILSPGCDLPFATPPANLEAVARVIIDPYAREIARTLVSTRTPGDLLDMRDYGLADKVIVDIITLDSEACAPCQYMVEAVKKIAPEFEGIVEWREHKIKQRESLVFMTSLMVRNIPTICIDGQITFVSRIPARDELVQAIQRRINEKMRLKIRQNKATLYILGDGGESCLKIAAHIDHASTELGMDIEVKMITDRLEIQGYGILPAQLPVVVLAKYQIKSSRTIPEPLIIREWLKDL